MNEQQVKGLRITEADILNAVVTVEAEFVNTQMRVIIIALKALDRAGYTHRYGGSRVKSMLAENALDALFDLKPVLCAGIRQRDADRRTDR